MLMWILGVLFYLTGAEATVLVNPPPPLPQKNLGETGYTIPLAGNFAGTPYNSAYINGSTGFRFLNTLATNVDNMIWLDVSSNKPFTVNANQHIVVTLSANSTAGSEIPLYGAGIVSSNTAPPVCGANGNLSCQGVRTGASNLSASYQAGTVLRVAFTFASLCNTPGASAGSLCSNNAYTTMAGKTLTQPIVVTFSVVNDYVTTGAVSGGNVDTTTFTLSVSDIPPVISCPTGGISSYYFPGDGQVYINPANYGAAVGNGATASDAGVELDSLIFMASRVGSGYPLNPISSSASLPSNEIAAYVTVGGGDQAVTGFVNSVNGSDNVYQAYLHAQNKVGLISPLSCSVPSPFVASQSIKGVLTESKCFIATAAFQDGRAGPVMMLRRFRDRILAKSDMGREFIRTYYRHSPALAEWAWDKPVVRSIALRLLAPVELAAWFWLKLVDAEEVSSTQPYIDRLKKSDPTLDIPDEANPPRAPAAPASRPGTYTSRIRSGLEPEESSEGYSEKERAKIGDDPWLSRPLEVNSGKSVRKVMERPDIESAIGFKIGVSPGMTVTNSSGTIGFDALYGTSWQPELLLHYERQLFHSEFLGSFGVGFDTGLSYSTGYGLLSFNFNGNSVSQTRFSFLQIPLIASATYRFNLLRVIRPYVSAGAGTVFYTEVREDEAGDKRGYSFVFSGSGGLALALDFFDSKTALDGWLSRGIQHTYLIAEYFYLSSFNRTGVSFGRSGIYAGFLFEI
jgi:hypothetical protein